MCDIIPLLSNNQVSSNWTRSVVNHVEDSLLSATHKTEINLPTYVSSTLSVAFSCNGYMFASTHGDHTVKVFIFDSLKQICNFHGHPRTPWTVKFHTSLPHILASGCIGYEVRVWDTEKAACINKLVLDSSVISIAFHPTKDFLAITSGSELKLWNWEQGGAEGESQTAQESSNLPVIKHNRNLRAVIFHPSGEYIFAAAPNGPKSPYDVAYCR